jgi:hypothetical protein
MQMYKQMMQKPAASEAYGPQELYGPPEVSEQPQAQMPAGHQVGVLGEMGAEAHEPMDLSTLSPEAKRIMEGVPESKTPSSAQEVHARIKAHGEDPAMEGRVEERLMERDAIEHDYRIESDRQHKAEEDAIDQREAERKDVESKMYLMGKGRGRSPAIPRTLDDMRIREREMERDKLRKDMGY